MAETENLLSDEELDALSEGIEDGSIKLILELTRKLKLLNTTWQMKILRLELMSAP